MELIVDFWTELAELGRKHPVFWRKHEQELLHMLISNGFPYNEYTIYSKMSKYLTWQANMV